MTDEPSERALAEAQSALSRFARGPAKDAATEIGDAFEQAAQRIASDLTRASLAGEVSFKKLAKTALEELAKLALNQIFPSPSKPAPDIVGAATGAVASALTVNFHLGAGANADSIRRHQSQIAAHVARAAAYGTRNG